MSSASSSESIKSTSSGQPKKRSRTGCVTCRSRGYKCDENKPVCLACTRLGRACQYRVATKWINETVVYKCCGVRKQASSAASDRTAIRSLRSGDTRNQRPIADQQARKWNQSGAESHAYAPRKSIKSGTIPSPLLPHSLDTLDLRLLNHWSTHLAPALDFSATNSFCYFITPMALSPQRTPALYHSLMSLSAAHLATHNPVMEVLALRHQQRAINLLKGIVETNEIGEEALATVLMLRIFEDFAASANSTAAMYHGRGASSIIRSGGIKASKSPTAAFLLSIFSYYDVISSISLEQSTYLSPQESLSTQDSETDLFMHYTRPILYQLSEISSLVDYLKRTASSHIPLPPGFIIHRVQPIMQKLEIPIDSAQAPLSHNDYIFTAEAYRHAGLVYLAKVLMTWSVPLISTPVIISASSCLSELAHVPVDAPVTARHLYPLFTAACECFGRDRVFARERLKMLADRGGGLPNVKRVWGLVQRVWMQRDALKDGAKVKLGCFEVMKAAGQVILIS